jgi:heat-inducible transcriptional repressor
VTLELDDRKAAILKAIVRNYVHGGEPVGSKRLVEEWSLGVSAATVRAEMAALEEAGYITAPHTSAGRIPTDLGYRYFVDSLQGTDTTPLSADQRTALEGLLLGSSDLEDLLWRATNALSRLTHLAALVTAPRLDRSRIRHIELVRLGSTSVLAVMIAETGRVMKRLLDLETAVADHDVQRARYAVNEVAVGLRTDQAPEVITGLAAGAPPEVRGLIDAVADAVRRGLSGTHPSFEQVFVGGTANIAAGHFHCLEEVKQVYETLEEQMVVLKVLRDALAVGDPGVRIGAELPLVELAPCSIVAASYEATRDAVGSLGVLGPTRMDYPRTLAAVQAVASSLEKALAELTGGQG